jgi:hypothetical protein
MECSEEIRMKLTLLAEGSLPENERQTVEEHLGSCPACRTTLDETRRLLGLLAGAQLPEPAPEFLGRLPAAVYNEVSIFRKVTPIRKPRVWKPAAAAGLAAAATLVLFFTPFFIQPKHSAAPLQQSLRQTAGPENIVIATFSYNPPAEKSDSSADQNPVALAETIDTQDLDSIDSQIDATLTPKNSDLFNVIETISDDEAKEMLDTFDDNDPNDNG